jgi:hypothetical protein
MFRGTLKIRRLRAVLLGSAVVLGMLALIAPVAARPAEPPKLRLHRGTFDARLGVGLSVADGLADAAPDLAIIQFAAPIAPAEQAALRATGVEVLEYIPDNAYLVRGDTAQRDAAARLPNVYARAAFLPADKLAPELLAGLAKGEIAQPIHLLLRSWPGRAGALAADLAAQGIDPTRPIDASQIMQLARLPSLRWAEPAPSFQLLNDKARAIMRVPQVWQDYGIYGKGQVIGVADSGLDTGDAASLSPDFAGRVVASYVLSDGGDLADQFGHGTHVAGSVAGAGAQSGANPALHQYEGSFAGVAPEASLVIQAFETSPEGAVLGLGDDPYPVFAQAYAGGARIHTNSWGGPTGGFPLFEFEEVYGAYPTSSMRTDQFLWDHPDMTIFFAAGNTGNDGPYFPALFECLPLAQDGVVDPDSINAPGTAKNVITVGASESVRGDAPNSTKTWKDFNDSCFGVEPLASDKVSDSASGMAAFSSRGPTDDGRIKPDIVAPGTNILSNRTHVPGANKLWGYYDSNPNYLFSGGTSMATPLAAGAGALIREWLTRQGIANPSAAAVKATLLNTAYDMAPGQYGSGAQPEVPFTRPNSVAGWGRVDLGFIAAPAPYRLWSDDHTGGLATGQVARYTNSASQPLIAASSAPLRVMLAWTDPPASLSASKQLVNDLDLVVTGPDGHSYWGNAVLNGDRTNNVEGIVIPNPTPGPYTIEVRAHNVPIGAQPYALSVAGALSSVALGPEPRLFLPMTIR